MNEVSSPPSFLEADQTQLLQAFLLRDSRCSTLPLEPSFPRPFHPRQSRRGLQRSSLNRKAADTNHSGPGNGGLSLGPAALRGWAGLTSRLPEPPGQGQRWCRGRQEPPPPDDARPPHDAELPWAARRRRLRGPATAEIRPETSAPRAHPQRAGDGHMAAGRQAPSPERCRRRPPSHREAAVTPPHPEAAGMDAERAAGRDSAEGGRGGLGDFVSALPPEIISRIFSGLDVESLCHACVRDVQGLAPRHRQQRAAVAAPLPGRARRLPAGDRLRPREWLFLEDYIVEKLLEKQNEARMA